MNLVNTGLSLLTLCLSMMCANAQVVVGQTHRIQSAILKEVRNYRVYLPESYKWAKDRKYPVLYVLDAQSQFLHTAASVDYLAAQGDIPEMIVVGIDSTVRVRDFTPTEWPEMWVGGGGAGNFKSFLSKELIPAIEHKYRTDGFRALFGVSAGGLFALYCLTSEPTLFRAYFAVSPSLDWDKNWPQRSLEKSFESTGNLSAFLYAARSDDYGSALADYERFVLTLKTKSPQGFRWFSQAFPEETHSGVPLLALIDALRHLYFGYHFHNDLIIKGFPYAEKHFQEVSKVVGWTLAIPEDVIDNLGQEALSQGKTEDAIKLLKQNVVANPNSASAHDSLADGYAKAGLMKEAVREAERAVALATKFANPSRSNFIKRAKLMHERLKQGTMPPK